MYIYILYRCIDVPKQSGRTRELDDRVCCHFLFWIQILEWVMSPMRPSKQRMMNIHGPYQQDFGLKTRVPFGFDAYLVCTFLSQFPFVFDAALLLDAAVLATGGVAICSGTAHTDLWAAQVLKVFSSWWDEMGRLEPNSNEHI